MSPLRALKADAFAATGARKFMNFSILQPGEVRDVVDNPLLDNDSGHLVNP